MIYCRIASGTPPNRVAKKLGIDTCTYKAIESGEILITPGQALQLGKLYNLVPNYIYDEAMQTDLILTKNAIINILNREIRVLKEKLGQ
jgi:plasmid maintenance system antidote protein VapI